MVGSVLSSLLDYKLRKSLIKKEFIFKQKIKQYEAISGKINQIHEWYFLGIKLTGDERYNELPRRIKSLGKILDHFLMFTPPNFNYISNIIKKYLKEYNKFLKEIATKEEYPEETISKISKEINLFTNKIRRQIKKELK